MPSAKQCWMILFSALVIIGLQAGLFKAMQRYQARKPDFAAFYQAGRNLDHKRFPGLFTHFPSLDDDAHNVFWPNSKDEYPADVLHPPYELILFGAYALFKYRVAYPLWWGCNISFIFLSAAVLWSHIPRLQNGYPYLLILIATFFPVLVAFVQGQDSVMLLGLLTLCYWSLTRGRDFRAGFVLSIGMFKFVVIIPLALWLILEKRWKSVAGFLCGCGALALIALWLVGMGGIVAYVRLLAGFGKKGPEEPGTETLMPNLRGLFHLSFSGVAPAFWISIGTILTSLALFIWAESRLSHYKDLNLDFALQVLLSCMISYHLYPHDGAILVLPFLLLLNHVFQDGTERAVKMTVLTCAVCAYFVPLVGGFYVGGPVTGTATLIILIVARNAAFRKPVLSAAHAGS